MSIRTNNVKILVVDDDAVIRAILGRYLSAQNYQLVFAADGEEALRVLEQNSDIGLVITDMEMPKMNGFDLIQNMRKKQVQIPVIVLTGYADPENRMAEALLELDVKRVLGKPVDFVLLLDNIKEAWSEYLREACLAQEDKKNRTVWENTNSVMREIMARQSAEIARLKKEQEDLRHEKQKIERILDAFMQSEDLGIAICSLNHGQFRYHNRAFQDLLGINCQGGILDILSHPAVVVSGLSEKYLRFEGKRLDFNVEISGKTIQLITNPIADGNSIETQEVLLLALDVTEKIFVEKLERQKSFDRERLLSELVEAEKKASLTDKLTGVGNRRSFDEAFSALVESGQIFTLAIFDIDHFKRVNDEYGHQAGDQVLAALASRLKKSFDGFLARYGGEEFAAILPDCADSSVVERIRLGACGRYHLEGVDITVTVSAGAGVFSPEMDSAEFFKQIDSSLYAAKAAGRNRLVRVKK